LPVILSAFTAIHNVGGGELFVLYRALAVGVDIPTGAINSAI
jgi:hypothetical protein